MAEKHQIYASGEQSNRVSVWRDYIYASHLKNGTWTITFVSDGEDGRYSRSIRNIRGPSDFVDALYSDEGFEMDQAFAKGVLKNLFPVSPTFTITSVVYNDIEYGNDETPLGDFLEVLPSFLASSLPLSEDFEVAAEFGKKVFKAMSECLRNYQRPETLSIDGTTLPIAWSKRINKKLRMLRTDRLIEEHCRKSEWEKSTGHSHAAIGNWHKYSSIKKFASQYYAEHGQLPVGDFVLGKDFMRSANFSLGKLAVKFK